MYMTGAQIRVSVMYLNIHICGHIYVYGRIYAYVYTYIYIHICMYIYIYICVCIHMWRMREWY